VADQPLADNGYVSVYFILSNKNNKCYVGSTEKDPKLRLDEHNAGSNSWTKLNRPFSLVYYETYACNEDARRRELFYKSGIGRRIKGAIISEMSKKINTRV
jgi:putative endonuclease